MIHHHFIKDIMISLKTRFNVFGKSPQKTIVCWLNMWEPN